MVARNSLAVPVAGSSCSVSPRDSEWTGGGPAPLSNSVIVRWLSGAVRTACWNANLAADPILKLECLPPSVHTVRSGSVDVVGGPRVAAGDDQVPLPVGIERVHVEVVERRPRALGHRLVAVGERDVIEAVPLEQEQSGLDVDLLDDRVQHDLLL